MVSLYIQNLKLVLEIHVGVYNKHCTIDNIFNVLIQTILLIYFINNRQNYCSHVKFIEKCFKPSRYSRVTYNLQYFVFTDLYKLYVAIEFKHKCYNRIQIYRK